jgi:DNA-directed RNA polymerase specialized sigma24 family protein
MAARSVSVPLPDGNHERAVQVTELFRGHNRTLVRFLQAKLQDPQEAREIAQEAYVRLLESERAARPLAVQPWHRWMSRRLRSLRESHSRALRRQHLTNQTLVRPTLVMPA